MDADNDRMMATCRTYVSAAGNDDKAAQILSKINPENQLLLVPFLKRLLIASF